jgi:hypothetical protein
MGLHVAKVPGKIKKRRRSEVDSARAVTWIKDFEH